ncbi:ribosome-binding factor A [Chlorella sorokiniana]|uniref:Ribosome-binding factor A n=1 Tax=Chlorella sorokiniana TaxID=3076 RepID=A0A2P6THW2_CHLSO|nr:ribosome-binding factor A [Chlorella sorokiniana]|eukprot:PRW33870.1 ribosome-binding factor A [Chlorella sorokiniana]
MSLSPVLQTLLQQLTSLRSFLPACSSTLLSSRSFAAAGRGSGSGGSDRDEWSDDELPAVNPKHRSATEVVWPATKQQERFASRVQGALETALLHNAQLRDALVTHLGFAVKEVRMSPDHLKAFIQWDSVLGREAAAPLQRELARMAPKLRSEVAKVLRARNAPHLVFRRDAPTAKQQELEDIFAQLDQEAADDAAAAAAGAAAADAGAAAGEAACSKMAGSYILTVHLGFQNAADRDEVLAAFHPLAEHVRANEEGTITYQWLQSDSDPLKCLILERYTSKQYLDDVHCQSEPFKAFFSGYLEEQSPWRKAHPFELSLQGYVEGGAGHAQR